MDQVRAELLAVIEDAESSGDLVGHVKTWLRWAEGRIDETATFALAPDERRQVGRDDGTVGRMDCGGNGGGERCAG